MARGRNEIKNGKGFPPRGKKGVGRIIFSKNKKQPERVLKNIICVRIRTIVGCHGRGIMDSVPGKRG